MGCGCKNKGNTEPVQTTNQTTTNTTSQKTTVNEDIKQVIKKTVEKYYNVNKKTNGWVKE